MTHLVIDLILYHETQDKNIISTVCNSKNQKCLSVGPQTICNIVQWNAKHNEEQAPAPGTPRLTCTIERQITKIYIK